MTIHKIHINKGNCDIEVDTEKLSDDVLYELVAKALTTILNGKMTEIKNLKEMNETELAQAHKAAKAQAEENLADLYDGKISKRKNAKKDKVPQYILNEAKRMAKDWLIAQIKASDGRVGSYTNAQKIAMAEYYVANDPIWIKEATERLSRRVTPEHAVFDLSAFEKQSTAMVKAKKEAAAERKATEEKKTKASLETIVAASQLRGGAQTPRTGRRQ